MRFSGLLILATAALTAQQAPPAFRASVDLVPVFATVSKADGSFAQGLTKDDFVVLDNGVPQDITSFSSEAQSISASVILDTSSSMRTALPHIYKAAGAFLNSLQPNDRAMIGSLFYVGPPLTSDKARLRTSLDLLPKDPASPVWAAIARSLTALAPETNRRVILIYTDGRNTGEELLFPGVRNPPKTTPAQLLARVESHAVMIYAIGVEGASISGDMKTIAKRSGGRATELRANDDLAAALAAVADELHHQYLLGFTPTTFDGKTHKLEVRVKTTGLLVRARESYLATK
jgi:Ca-activated chloride channel family protein